MDVYAQKTTGYAKYQFTWETVKVYCSCRVYNAMLDLDTYEFPYKKSHQSCQSY